MVQAQDRSVRALVAFWHQRPQHEQQRHHRHQPIRNKQIDRGTSAQNQWPRSVKAAAATAAVRPETRRGGRGDHSQRLQTLYPSLVRDRAGHEWQDRRARLPEARDPPDRAGQEPPREDAPRLVHHDGVDRAQEDADERDSDSAPDEGRYEPDDELKAVRDAIPPMLQDE